MAIINIHEAKTHLSRLLSRVQSGEEIVIAKAGKPIAKLVSVEKKLLKRTPGTAKGRLKIKKSFFKPLPDSILREFEN
jgi:prevent-host-death family protein